MIEEKTVLILGAGASMEYGFPSGEELIEDIINYLDGFILTSNIEQKIICMAYLLRRYHGNKGAIETYIFARNGAIIENL